MASDIPYGYGPPPYSMDEMSKTMAYYNAIAKQQQKERPVMPIVPYYQSSMDPYPTQLTPRNNLITDVKLFA